MVTNWAEYKRKLRSVLRPRKNARQDCNCCWTCRRGGWLPFAARQDDRRLSGSQIGAVDVRFGSEGVDRAGGLRSFGQRTVARRSNSANGRLDASGVPVERLAMSASLRKRTAGGLVVYLATEAAASVVLRLQAYQRHHQVHVPGFVIVKSPINLFDGQADTTAVLALIDRLERDLGGKVSRANSICSALTGLSPAPWSSPFSASLTQLPSVAFGMPSTRAVTDASCPAFTSLTASSLNSSVYLALCFVPSFLLIACSP